MKNYRFPQKNLKIAMFSPEFDLFYPEKKTIILTNAKTHTII